MKVLAGFVPMLLSIYVIIFTFNFDRKAIAAVKRLIDAAALPRHRRVENGKDGEIGSRDMNYEMHVNFQVRPRRRDGGKCFHNMKGLK